MHWFALGGLALLADRGARRFAALRHATALPGVTVDQPVAIVSPPGDARRIFVVEKPGRILVFDASSPPRIRDRLPRPPRARRATTAANKGLRALAFHPDWQTNRQFFVWYTHRARRWLGSDREIHLARFEISAGNPDQAEPAAGQPAPHPHPAMRPGTYAIPPDNPFVGAREFQCSPLDATKVRTEFWAIGLRNSWRMAFDSAPGRLWCADVGQNLYKEINVIVRGGNYSWDFREGNFPFRSRDACNSSRPPRRSPRSA